MTELTINLKKLKESDIFVEEYLLLALIYNGEDISNYKFINGEMEHLLYALEQEMWVSKVDDEYVLRSKALALFEEEKNTINFDEFWNEFPSSTPKGRPLRAASKEWGGKITKDYETCRKKYLSKVKNIKIHLQIVEIVKARVSSGDYEYMNNMETYINTQKWEQDVKYLKSNTDWTANRV